nr:S8 family peptidase [Eubacterium sp.]
MNHVRSIVHCPPVHQLGILGKHIGIAILDSGICKHPDFGDRIIGWHDTVLHKPEPYDDNGHGTHVAGIAAGSGTVSHGTFCGIAPEANIISVKILDRYGEGMVSHITSGIDWVIENRFRYNIRIVNISVGALDGKRFSETSKFVQKVNSLWDLGLVVVASAGNKGPKSYSISAPGNSRKIITVGYVSKQSTSSIGPTTQCIKKPDVVTPGHQINSCCHLYPTGKVYTKKSGTSMATPVVSGSIALLLSTAPSLTPKDVKIRLKKSCIDLHQPHSIQGWGLLDVQRLVL